MLHFGTQSIHTLVWGQRTSAAPISTGESVNQEKAVRQWLSMPGQTTGAIGFYRTATGQPLQAFPAGSYAINTYVTSYTYASGKYSIALEVHLSLSESLSLSDAAPVNVIYGVTLAEILGVAGTETDGKSLSYTLNESLSLADTYAFNVIYGVSLTEALQLTDIIKSNASLTAYVTNLNTGAVSTYRNFNFNSFAKIGSKYYGAGDDGIFELAGNTDAGTQIAVSVKLGTEDFEIPKVMSSDVMKRVDTAYIGVKTDGSVILKVTANGSTNIYTLSPTTQTSTHTGRLMLGKGVASRYWDFEITNVAGSDIFLESVTLYPVALTRRVVEN